MSGQLFGAAYVSVDGSLLPTLPGAKIDIGGKERTPVAGDNRMLGFTEAPKPSMVTVDIALSQGMSVTKLAKTKDATITFECDTGQSYIVRDAYCTKTLSLGSNDSGKVTLEFAGEPAEEMGV